MFFYKAFYCNVFYVIIILTAKIKLKDFFMNLFDYQQEQNLKKQAPLASRLRPTTLEEFVGQEHIVGKNKLLYRAIMADKLSSVILYGPPGTGKTTLAKIIANNTKSNFVQLNATTSGVKDIKEVIDNSKTSMAISSKRTILFVDEIHRFNKSQQDTLLPHVEDGTIILIGATTENPFYEVNKAIVSRSIVFKLNSLTIDNVKTLLKRAITDKEKGYGYLNIKLDDDALNFLADAGDGDARKSLNALELSILTQDNDGLINITLEIAEDCIQKRAINYDKNSSNHYDVISAFIKSMRGSDPDATLYYLARMIYAGEDPIFIARRIMICASEDVGNADPHALQLAVSAFLATEAIGLPECRIILAQAACYVACSPKSNACYIGIEKALSDVANVKINTVATNLINKTSEREKQIYNNNNYKYPHDYKNNYVKAQYLPDELVGKTYYNPTENGVEKRIKQYLEFLKTL